MCSSVRSRIGEIWAIVAPLTDLGTATHDGESIIEMGVLLYACGSWFTGPPIWLDLRPVRSEWLVSCMMHAGFSLGRAVNGPIGKSKEYLHVSFESNDWCERMGISRRVRSGEQEMRPAGAGKPVV
jgi:hypothetical protein